MDRKILIIVENLPVPFDTRVWQEATTLAANGYTVSVICPKGKGYDRGYEFFQGVHIYRHNLPKERNGALWYALEYVAALWHEYRLSRRVWKEHGFHCIQGCNPPDNIWIVARLFRNKGVDYIFDHHDICPELFEAKFGKATGLLYRMLLWLEKQTYRHAKFAFVTNLSYRQIAIKRGCISPENVMVLRSGPRMDRLRIQLPKPEIRRGRKYMVGYLGVIGRQEGLEYMLKAAQYVRAVRGRDDILWAVVGNGPDLNRIRELCGRMGLDDIFVFTGRVPDNIMLDYINTADVCINCDEYNAMNDKSTMNKVLEYMALAKPIVQFDLTEGKYSAQGASLYAERNNAEDMGDKILKLLDNLQMREHMGLYGRNRVLNELSWEHTSKALLAGYDKYFRERRL